MKVVCICTTYSVTLGKTYEVDDKDAFSISSSNLKEYHRIRNDNGTYLWIDSSCFKTVKEIRDNKLKELGV